MADRGTALSNESPAESSGVIYRPEPARNAPGETAQALDSMASGADNAIEETVVEVLRSIYDPEIPVNIYDLGLIYGIDVLPLGRVTVRMTLTTPACPVAGSLPPEVETKLRAVDGVSDATVELVWDPPWNMDMMSEDAKLELNLL